MAVLRGLQGVKRKEIEAVFFKKPSEIKAIVDSGKGATTAGDNGAINFWKDDDGNYCGSYSAWCVTKEFVRSPEIIIIIARAKIWLRAIV